MQVWKYCGIHSIKEITTEESVSHLKLPNINAQVTSEECCEDCP